ncbi:MAG: hypothetical protein IT186_12580 [Acidobacteria bacterium]|nr:hypothetical protein [Acidobacteriota bacterium]MCG3194139.1 hypothetical protein [Thermoanaerobaculia bacterium]MCK6681065.1 hypothetical protein [Thermoanaerobaculia bacterium]
MPTTALPSAHPSDAELILTIEGKGLAATVAHLYSCFACASLVRGFVAEYLAPQETFEAEKDPRDLPWPAAAVHGR